MAGTKRATPDDTTARPSKKSKSVPDTAASSRPRRVTKPDAQKHEVESQPKAAANTNLQRPGKVTSKAVAKHPKPKATVKKNDAVKRNEPKASDNKTQPKPSKTMAKASNTKPDDKKPKPTPAPDGERSYWLMKAEPESRIENGVDVKFSIHDLEARTEPEAWDGVRNYQARNNMRSMRKGDLAFFYHSNCKIPGIVGVMEIVREHQPDESALDPGHPYHDPKETKENPKWSVVHVEHRLTFDEMLPLKELQKLAKEDSLSEMQLLKSSRLSVSKVRKEEWDFIMKNRGRDAETLEAIA